MSHYIHVDVCRLDAILKNTVHVCASLVNSVYVGNKVHHFCPCTYVYFACVHCSLGMLEHLLLYVVCMYNVL